MLAHLLTSTKKPEAARSAVLLRNACSALSCGGFMLHRSTHTSFESGCRTSRLNSCAERPSNEPTSSSLTGSCARGAMTHPNGQFALTKSVVNEKGPPWRSGAMVNRYVGATSQIYF